MSAADLPDAIASAIAATEPTPIVLEAASAWATARAASVVSGPDLAELRLPAPSKPSAPAPVVALLRRMRADSTLGDRLQHEALTALAVRGLTLSPDLLLELLDDVHRPSVARDVAAVLDARGWAVVALDEGWSRELARSGAASEPGDPRIWEEGALPQRVEYLALLRRADPDSARALLEAPGFAKEPPASREAFLAELEAGLSLTDEPFLEAQLDDRAKGVRRVAAALLSTLPGSAYVRRAEELARRHLQLKPRLLRGPVLLSEPVPVTDQTRRDGYNGSVQTSHQSLGGGSVSTPPERSQLIHLMLIVPTSRWKDVLGAGAIELVSAPAEYNGSPIDLLPVFAVAARRWRDADLAEAIVSRDPSRLADLLGVLPTERRERLAVPALGASTTPRLLERVVAEPMSPRLSVAALDAVRRLVDKKTQLHQLTQLVVPLALNADANAAPALVERFRALEEQLPTDARGARRESARAAAALQLRQALADALLGYPVTASPSPAPLPTLPDDFAQEG